MEKILFLVGLLFIFYFVCMWSETREHFEGSTNVVDELYDAAYAAIYKPLWHSSEERLGFEQVSIKELSLVGRPTSSVKILDMACGISQHACFFKELGVDFLGVDTSEPMLAEARKNCPTAKFKKVDVTQASGFAPKSFTTCLLLGFSVYEFQNPKVVFDNANVWLEPDGVLVVHMVEPDKYDPLLDLASPFAAFSLQKYSYDRQTKSEIFFNDFKYIGNFQKGSEDDAKYKETLVYNDPEKNGGTKYREQVHEWNMPSMERLIEVVKTSGFKLKEKVHLVSASKEYQYLVYFTK
jgi:SAM-dependent methyltransferase